MGRLKGKIAIITGGGGGIGRATAEKFAEEEVAGLLIADLDEARAQDVASALEAQGVSALGIRTDVAHEPDVQAMVAAAISKWQRIDILFNNAAKTEAERDVGVVDHNPEEWNRVFSVNMTGAMLCCKHVIPEMIRSGGGAIIHSSSGIAVLAEPQWAAYSCSKAGLIRLSQHIAVSHGHQGIRSNAIIIGVIETGAIKAAMPGPVRDIMKDNILLRRLGRPSDIANTVAFLASEEAAFITGADIVVDGGQLAHQPSLVQIEQLVGRR